MRKPTHAVPVVVRGVSYPSMKACARAFGISVQAVWHAVQRGNTDGVGLGRNWRHRNGGPDLRAPSVPVAPVVRVAAR